MPVTDRITLEKKYQKLQEILRSLESVAVAFSGGVDSTFLLKVAQETLGDKAMAITACPCSFTERELKETEDFCRENKISQEICRINEFEIPGFRQNPPDRCYICKKGIFTKLWEKAKEKHINMIVEGSNMDDLGDYRPGRRAIMELGVRSLLQEAGLYKEEIRELSKDMNLPTWNKPSFACLASRFVYGETITEEKLRMVDQAEQFLMNLGFRQFRVRIHGTMARIEVPSEDILKIADHETREKITEKFRSLGFSYVTLDLQGFRSGSMNEVLGK
ncbi:MAG: ATP-dependent sacrificial sulfur transferase LarE [Ruminococcus sp. SR1/5]|nr:ATP-dependent sacrificial sulfur transferase LarE [Ruminococcus sp.]